MKESESKVLEAAAILYNAIPGYLAQTESKQQMKQRNKVVGSYINTLKIKTPNDRQRIRFLSGGNQQKVILARWMATDPKLIILDEPTRGIDVGAKQEVEKLVLDFAEQGISVIYISSELSELVRNCDRIIVLRDGRNVGELSGDEIKEKSIMAMIAAESEEG